MHSVNPHYRHAGDLTPRCLLFSSKRRFTGNRLSRVEAVEARLLLSAYSISDIGSLTATTTGSTPSTAVVFDSTGDLFGTTLEGSPPTPWGAVFEIASGSSAITTVASFNYTDGAYPGSLTLDAAGDIFGSTGQDGDGFDPSNGNIFEIAKGSKGITALAEASTLTSGVLALDGAGNLFGTGRYGGNGYGSVFELEKGSSSVAAVAAFSVSNGSNLASGITLDGSGDMFGTASAGGGSGDGTVFEIANGSDMLTALASFNGTNGSVPSGAVTLDPAGNLFGTTYTGGANNDGTVFEVAHGTSTITTLASFNGANGSGPNGGVTMNAAGDLFGTAHSGGTNNDGTVFEIANGSNIITTLSSFDGTNGSDPLATVTLQGGKIYGTASSGGVNNAGAVFELVANPVPAVTLAMASGSNPSNATQPLSFQATAAGGVPNGETITLEDASNNNAIVASGTLSNGTATLSVPADTLSAGRHNLIAVYGGDANFAASESAPYTQTVWPDVTGISPSSGPAAGGTTVTITGGGFIGATAVDFGSTPAASFTVNSTGTQITAVDPAGSGTVDVTVVTPGGTSATSSADQFTYTASTVTISSVVVNGNNSALAGVQRSMVNSIEYTFAQAVILNQTNAFSIALHSGQSGTLPTLIWTAINPDASGGSTQWVVTFSGAGVSGGSIANGVYDITLNAAGVSGESGGTLASSRTDTFYRLFGDAQGTKNVSTADYNAFLSTNGLKSTAPGYLAEFAADGSGKIDTSDYNAFLADLGKKLTGFTPTI